MNVTAHHGLDDREEALQQFMKEKTPMPSRQPTRRTRHMQYVLVPFPAAMHGRGNVEAEDLFAAQGREGAFRYIAALNHHQPVALHTSWDGVRCRPRTSFHSTKCKIGTSHQR